MSLREISSKDNPQFKELRLLASSTQARRRAQRSLLDGVHLCQAYLDQVGPPLSCVVGESAQGNPEVAAVLARCVDSRTDIVVLADKLFDQLSQVEQGIDLMFLIQPPAKRDGEVPVLKASAVLLDNLQDPGNVGSILRSAVAAGVRTVCCSPGTAFVWSSKVLRAGMGAHFALEIYENVDLQACLQQAKVPVFATSSHAESSLYACDLQGEAAWIFGHEGQGVSEGLLQKARTVGIPHAGPMESLNVAACAAVCLFEHMRQRTKAG